MREQAGRRRERGGLYGEKAEKGNERGRQRVEVSEEEEWRNGGSEVRKREEKEGRRERRD